MGGRVGGSRTQQSTQDASRNPEQHCEPRPARTHISLARPAAQQQPAGLHSVRNPTKCLGDCEEE